MAAATASTSASARATALLRARAMAIVTSKAVLRLQLALSDDAARSESDLLAAATILTQSDYDGIVVERSVNYVCGHPLCRNPLPSSVGLRRGRYSLPIRELEETYKYCSKACLVASKAFAANLPEERTSKINLAMVKEILARFDRLQDGKEQDLGKEGDLGISKLTIREKEDAGKGDVSLDEWIGPSNAIEGYVPQLDHKQGSKVEQHDKESKLVKDTKVGNLDFTSTIFYGNDDSAAATENASESINKQLEDIVITEKMSKKSKNSSKSSKHRKHKRSSSNESQSTSKPASNDNSSNLLEGVNSLVLQNLGPYAFDYSEQKLSEDPQKVLESDKCPENATGSYKQCADGDEITHGVVGKDTKLKTALKTSGSKTIDRSVKWADQEENTVLKEIKDLKESSALIKEENDHSLRLVSAEACAAALIKAAEVVASGKSDTGDAVSEAGILILPQLQNVDGEKPQEDADSFELDNGQAKLQKKTVLLDTDIFDVEDSWHDTSPESFSLTLSSFATMYMALFGWITCSSLAFIYGHDESSRDNFLVVNGREYPRRIVLEDGQSSEIRRTIDGCVCRALPGLVLNLLVSIPVSSMEKALGQLLDTMSFVEALPAFRQREWQVIVLLFLEALSVQRLPALTPYVTNKEVLMHKVLNAAKIGMEEYDSMNDLIIPLGRLHKDDIN